MYIQQALNSGQTDLPDPIRLRERHTPLSMLTLIFSNSIMSEKTNKRGIDMERVTLHRHRRGKGEGQRGKGMNAVSNFGTDGNRQSSKEKARSIS